MDNVIYLLDIDKYRNDETILNTFYSWASDEKRKRADRFLRREDYLRAVLADGLVRTLYGKYSGDSPKNACITFNKYKKPYLKDNFPFYYNVSHSGKYVVCAVSEEECGVDIEQVSDVGENLSGYYSDPERQYLSGLSKEDYNREFIKLWTLKESYVKCCGKGLYIDLKSFSFIWDNKFVYEFSDEGLVFSTFSADDSYFISSCGNADFRLENITLN